MVPVAGFVAVAVLTRHRKFTERDAKVGAGFRFDPHRRGGGEPDASREHAALVLGRRHQAFEDLGRLGRVEHPRSAPDHLVLLVDRQRLVGRAQDVEAQEVDHEVGAFQRVHRAAIGAQRGVADYRLHGEDLRAQINRGGEGAVDVARVRFGLGEDDRRFARLELGEHQHLAPQRDDLGLAERHGEASVTARRRSARTGGRGSRSRGDGY